MSPLVRGNRCTGVGDSFESPAVVQVSGGRARSPLVAEAALSRAATMLDRRPGRRRRSVNFSDAVTAGTQQGLMRRMGLGENGAVVACETWAHGEWRRRATPMAPSRIPLRGVGSHGRSDTRDHVTAALDTVTPLRAETTRSRVEGLW